MDNETLHHYETTFDAEAYMKRFCPTMGKTIEQDDFYTWFTDCFCELFQTGTVNGARLLDIGTGPNIFSVVPAASHCESIILSDFSPQNRHALAKWLDGSSRDSFSHIFEYVTAKQGKSELPGELELKLRSKIAAILPVNLLQEQPFAPCHLPKFNIITSSLCLEAATTDYQEYKKIVKRVMSLLEKGGHLFLCIGLDCGFYSVEGVNFNTCRLSGEQVKTAWSGSGLDIITYKEVACSERDDDNTGGLSFLYGRT